MQILGLGTTPPTDPVRLGRLAYADLGPHQWAGVQAVTNIPEFVADVASFDNVVEADTVNRRRLTLEQIGGAASNLFAFNAQRYMALDVSAAVNVGIGRFACVGASASGITSTYLAPSAAKVAPARVTPSFVPPGVYAGVIEGVVRKRDAGQTFGPGTGMGFWSQRGDATVVDYFQANQNTLAGFLGQPDGTFVFGSVGCPRGQFPDAGRTVNDLDANAVNIGNPGTDEMHIRLKWIPATTVGAPGVWLGYVDGVLVARFAAEANWPYGFRLGFGAPINPALDGSALRMGWWHFRGPGADPGPILWRNMRYWLDADLSDRFVP